MSPSALIRKRCTPQLLNNSFTRYLVVGVLSTLTHFAVLIFLVELFSADILIATVLAFSASLAVSFTLNYIFAFRANTPVIGSFFRFTIVALAGLGLNVGIMELFVNQLGIHYVYANFVAIVVVTLNNFSLHYLWTFKDR